MNSKKLLVNGLGYAYLRIGFNDIRDLGIIPGWQVSAMAVFVVALVRGWGQMTHIRWH